MAVHATKTNERWADDPRQRVAKYLAIAICFVASVLGWAAIIGLVLLLKPELPF